MGAYVLRRVLYAIPILLAVNILTFMLFFVVNTPEKIARKHIGKLASNRAVEAWLRERSLDLPYFYNAGWQRVGELSAKGPLNTANLILSYDGAYRVVIETPPGQKEAALRYIEMLPATLATQEGLSSFPKELQQPGGTELPATLGPRQFYFDVHGAVDKQPPLALSVRYGVGKALPPAKPAPKAGEPKESPEPAAEPAAESPGDAPSDAPPGPAAGPRVAAGHRILLEYQAPLSFAEHFTRTVFFQRSIQMLFFQYGKSDRGEDISSDMLRRAGPSLCLAIPALFISLAMSIFFGMVVAFYRGTYVDYYGVILCVILMSISGLFYIVGGQVIVGKWLHLAPISGFEYGFGSWRFLALPLTISLFSSIGGGTRFYRTVFLEETGRDYIRTARSKGLKESRVLFVHVLKNAMIPILTGVVADLPLLYSGSLLYESYFAIPGMGAYMLDAIQAEDFAIVQACTCFGSFMYIVGLTLTDISYTWVDPRVRLR